MKTEFITVEPTSVDKFESELALAASVIKKGGLVVFPTETVYGLGADATNPVAASKIFEAKGRPQDNPLIIHVAVPIDAEKYAFTNSLYYRLAERFMPGPLTVILKSRESVPPATRGGLDTVAVRCPENTIARRLIALSGTAIAAPSANLSGSPSPTTAQHVRDDMDGRVDVIIDGGACEFGLESTIVKIEDESRVTLLRPGRITPDELSEVCEVIIADAVTDKLKDGEACLSPGMKYRHYAPHSPLLLLDGEPEDAISYILKEGVNDVAVIAYDEDRELFEEKIKDADVITLGKRGDELSQAQHLFYLLREADKKDYGTIYAPLPQKNGIGLALYNRLIRAAAHRIINLKDKR